MTAFALSDTAGFAPTVALSLNDIPAAPDVARCISNVNVIAEPTALDHATLVVANAYPALRFTHGADAGLFREGTGLIVRGGYRDALSTLFDGEITSITSSFPASGMPTLTVEAQNRLHRLTTPFRTYPFTHVTDSEIAEVIAGRNDLAALTSPTTVVHTSLTQFHQDDLSFLGARAQAIGYELVVEGQTLNFRPKADASPPEFRLVWGDPQKAGQAGSYPLQSFEPRLNARGPVTSVQVRGQDPASRELILGTAQAGSEDVPGGRGETGTEVTTQAFGDDQLVIVDRPVLSQEEAETTARAIFNDRALDLVQATGTTAGIPDMRPGAVVEVAGVGLRFSGGYYLVRVTHTLGPSGYTTSFTARSSVVGAL